MLNIADNKGAIEELRRLTGEKLEVVIVVGGGSQNALLNELTAEAAGVEVRCGDIEASVVGNILNQDRAIRAMVSKKNKLLYN